MPGTLYVVATPIGNLADITLRALSTLREVDLIAAEDTRVTHNLLEHYGIDTPTTPYHQHSLGRKAEQLIEMLKAGKSIALVSDAGTPGISDPGHELIRMALGNDITIVAIPGPNAIITALAVSGLSTRRFAFDGFPPRRGGERRAFFKALEKEPRTMVFYESPHRLLSTLRDMRAIWGDRQIAVVREATKLFEEVHRGTIQTAIERFEAVKPKGEITIIVAGSTVTPDAASPEQIESALRELLSAGESERDAVRKVAAVYPVPKKEVYRRMSELRSETTDEG
jgi:16S rRNA (cytidine1402-2'-O)-methyltransferase